MAKIKLTMALDRYDRHVPFFDGTVNLPEGVELQMLKVGQSAPKEHGAGRHGRMLHDGEFDIAELGLSPYLMAATRNRDLPVVAIPVYPRRLFSQNRIHVNVDAGIETPMDLVGKRIAVSGFQVTLTVLAKGDLKRDYGVPWEEITWVTALHEEIPFTPKKGVVLEKLAPDQDAGEMLISGELDAMISPQPPRTLLGGSDRVRPLFADAKAETLRHFGTYGYYPIMHLVAIRRELVEREPWLARAVYDMFEHAKALAYEFYGDPNYSLMAWGRETMEEQRELLGSDPWPSGVAANRANLEAFTGYLLDQGLIDTPLPVDEMFVGSLLDT